MQSSAIIVFLFLQELRRVCLELQRLLSLFALFFSKWVESLKSLRCSVKIASRDIRVLSLEGGMLTYIRLA